MGKETSKLMGKEMKKEIDDRSLHFAFYTGLIHFCAVLFLLGTPKWLPKWLQRLGQTQGALTAYCCRCCCYSTVHLPYATTPSSSIVATTTIGRTYVQSPRLHVPSLFRKPCLSSTILNFLALLWIRIDPQSRTVGRSIKWINFFLLWLGRIADAGQEELGSLQYRRFGGLSSLESDLVQVKSLEKSLDAVHNCFDLKLRSVLPPQSVQETIGTVRYGTSTRAVSATHEHATILLIDLYV
jgi:hypothetical protein